MNLPNKSILAKVPHILHLPLRSDNSHRTFILSSSISTVPLTSPFAWGSLILEQPWPFTENAVFFSISSPCPFVQISQTTHSTYLEHVADTIPVEWPFNGRTSSLKWWQWLLRFRVSSFDYNLIWSSPPMVSRQWDSRWENGSRNEQTSRSTLLERSPVLPLHSTGMGQRWESIERWVDGWMSAWSTRYWPRGRGLYANCGPQNIPISQ